MRNNLHIFNYGTRIFIMEKNNGAYISLPIEKFNENDLDNSKSILSRTLGFTKNEKSMIKRNKLNTLYLIITKNCNLSCEFCSIRANVKTKTFDELSLGCFKNRILPLINQLSPRRIIITGGEPLIHFDILEILDLIKANVKIPIILQTNGILLTKKFINTLIDRVDSIEISTAHYNNLCKLDEVLKILTKSNIEYGLSYVYNGNIDHLLKVIDIAGKYNTKFLLNFVNKIGSALDQNIEIPNMYERINLLKTIAIYILENGYTKTFLTEIFFNSITPRFSCNALESMVVIQADGSIYPCHSINYQELLLGNVKTHTTEELVDIYINRKINKLKLELFSVDYKLPCKNCKIKYMCGGICGATLYDKTDFENICNTNKFFIAYNLLVYDKKLTIEDNLKNFIGLCNKDNIESVLKM